MLKRLSVKDFYAKDNEIGLDFSDGLTILTGDNGAGKTTLLNLIFNILNGDFETLMKINFQKIVLELDVENLVDSENETQTVHRIEIEKEREEQKEKERLKVSYFLNKKTFILRLRRVGFPFLKSGQDINYSYDLIQPKPDKDKEKGGFFNIGSFHESLSDLITKYKDLQFINLLKKNVIYFPTYRRIDSDIVQLLEQNYPVNNEVDFSEINRTINNFPNDRRVVGVNDNDIEHLYKSYSDKCRKLNSEGLNEVLKSFIQEMIISTYSNSIQENRKKTPDNLYEKAPEQLIDLSKQLGIKEINEKEIKEYFATQRKFVELSKSTAKVDIALKNKKDNKGTAIEKIFAESDFEILLSSLLSVGKNNNLIMKLINLYDQHMKRVNKQLEPYEYLKKSFDSFFKGKISLSLDNYSLNLSRSFKDLSTGEKQLITILSYAALSLNMENYKPLIIIDEPELSLHISWQMNLLNKLLDLPNINILLATHSPYVANSDYENNIWQLGEIDDY